jgi:hypothetical protein
LTLFQEKPSSREVFLEKGPPVLSTPQEAKYVEHWPNTTSAWASWSRFDIPVDRYGGVHSLLICTSSILGSPTCHRASQQENTYSTKYQKADRASTCVGDTHIGAVSSDETDLHIKSSTGLPTSRDPHPSSLLLEVYSNTTSSILRTV